MRVFHWCTRPCSSTSTTTSKPTRPDTENHLSTNALPVPAQDAHLFTFGSLQHHTVQIQTFKTNKHTHALTSDLVFTTPSTPESSRHVHQEPLGHNTFQVHISLSHTTVAVWKPSTTARCTTMRRRLGPGKNTTASPFGITNYRLLFPALPPFSPPLAFSTKRAATASQTMSRQTWPWTLQYRRLKNVRRCRLFLPIGCVGCVCGLRADIGMQRTADQDVERVVCPDQKGCKTAVRFQTSHTQVRHEVPLLSLPSTHTTFLLHAHTTPPPRFEFRALAVRKDMGKCMSLAQKHAPRRHHMKTSGFQTSNRSHNFAPLIRSRAGPGGPGHVDDRTRFHF